LRRHFGLDRAIVLFGKIEVGDAHGIYINVMSSQPVSHVLLDSVPHGGALRDELFRVAPEPSAP
jgi:hypothetical protein